MAKKKRENLKRFLKDIISLIVGKQAEDIAELLDSDKHVNEFIIAKKLGITINQTRNILYKISDKGLVSFIRKKDKRKGWYTYFWKIEIMKALEYYRGEIVSRMDQIGSQINSRETKQFYICELCHVEYNEENALLRDYTCPECGSILVLKDNEPMIKELKKSFEKLKKELDLVDEEIDAEREVLDKKLFREIKKREKEKKEKRAQKRREREKAAKKKTVKKVVKKKAQTKKKTKAKPVKKKAKVVKKKPTKKKVKPVKKAKTQKKKIVSKKKPTKKKVAKKPAAKKKIKKVSKKKVKKRR